MGERYPMTGAIEVNKQLEKAVKQTDNMEALCNDLLLKSKIQFTLRESGNYNDLIMKMLNYLIESANKTVSYKG